jgi:hypothetical protein
MHAVRGATEGGGSGGRSDERSPHLFAVRQRVGDDGVLASVVANVNLTTREGTIAYIHPVANLAATPAPEKSDVVIVARREDGESLDQFPVAVKLDSELGPEEDRKGLIDAILPINAEARRVELIIAGQLADAFRVRRRARAAGSRHHHQWSLQLHCDR